VLVIDEAGLVGSRQMERVLSHAAEAGAKVVLVGDPEQLQAIEAGAAFRALSERHGAAEITQVRRQHQAWQREATKELATERTAAALERYERAGMVHAHASKDEAKAALVEGWDVARRAEPERSQVMLAYTRVDVRALNELARARMQAAGDLGVERTVMTEQGDRQFAPGDRVMFLRNERSLGVKNGTLGTLERLEGPSLTVRLDGADRRAVSFDLKDYADVDHGYAATIHKAQGVTVDRAHVLASSFMDRHAAYVGLTRHREGVELHWAREDLRDRAGLDRVLSRERAKDTTLDYTAGFAERRGIVPRSEILVATRTMEREATRPTPTAQRSPFAGLKLGAERAVRPGAFAGLKLPTERAPVPDPSAALSRMQLEMAAAVYAKAWGDAEATRARGHAPLPHQTVALEQAGAALDQLRPEGVRDLGQALARDPELAARGVRDRAELVAAMTHEGRWRTEPGYRAEHYGQAWHGLEQAYAAARRPVERAAVRGRMETFVDRLERDPEGERQLLAREAGRVQARGDEQAPALRQLVAERERARAWDEERMRVLSRERSRGLSL